MYSPIHVLTCEWGEEVCPHQAEGLGRVGALAQVREIPHRLAEHPQRTVVVQLDVQAGLVPICHYPYPGPVQSELNSFREDLHKLEHLAPVVGGDRPGAVQEEGQVDAARVPLVINILPTEQHADIVGFLGVSHSLHQKRG